MYITISWSYYHIIQTTSPIYYYTSVAWVMSLARKVMGAAAPLERHARVTCTSCRLCAMIPTSSLRVEHLLSIRLTTLTSWLPIRPCNVHPSQGLCKASVGAVAWVAGGQTPIKPDTPSSRPRHHVDVGQTCPRTTYGAKSWVCNL